MRKAMIIITICLGVSAIAVSIYGIMTQQHLPATQSIVLGAAAALVGVIALGQRENRLTR